ncbi:hypothetical protein [Thiolapillus brandeum]|uniref:hypothetical protein n=1 Tax=Thiolapillus brandeum TaxID=1076588 RepID=UPI001185086A|nr:hypothetical protein [Thiolapillus brandeum]
MKNSLKKTVRWSTLASALGLLSIPVFQAQAAIFWPGGTGNPNKNQDFQEGYDTGTQDCRDAPIACGVKLYPMIKEQGYGETEPNDHILNADGLLLGQFYHGNTLGAFDEDWYYVTTDKPSQKLTVYFLADPGNFTDTGGWVLRVRDLNGNIIAAFDSSTGNADAGGQNAGDGGDTPQNTSPVDSAKITEVTLGKTGTYYISVASKENGGDYRGYNIAARLENTGQVTANPDENRFDTETEPNNDTNHADPLRSHVAMVGTFGRTLIKKTKITTPAKTDYEYFYKGCTAEKLADPANSTWYGFNDNSCDCDVTKDPVTGDPLDPVHPDPNDVDPPGGNPIPPAQIDNPDFACYAEETITPAKTEWIGIFSYDTDVYSYTSEGNEQLRIQICTRTECEFDRVHLKVQRGDTEVLLMDGPIEPGQVIDLGASLPGEYFFTFRAEKTGIDSDTGDPKVIDLVGPYDVLLMGTKMPNKAQ